MLEIHLNSKSSSNSPKIIQADNNYKTPKRDQNIPWIIQIYQESEKSKYHRNSWKSSNFMKFMKFKIHEKSSKSSKIKKSSKLKNLSSKIVHDFWN